MTKQEATWFVNDTFDDDAPSEEELEEAFQALYERLPDDDELPGLWTHICAAVSHCPCSLRGQHYKTLITINDGTIRSEYVMYDEEKVRVEHVTADGCPHDILDHVVLGWDHDESLADLAEDVADCWVRDYDLGNADEIEVIVTASQCNRQATARRIVVP